VNINFEIVFGVGVGLEDKQNKGKKKEYKWIAINITPRHHCSIITARKFTQRIHGNYRNNNMTSVNWFSNINCTAALLLQALTNKDFTITTKLLVPNKLGSARNQLGFICIKEAIFYIDRMTLKSIETKKRTIDVLFVIYIDGASNLVSFKNYLEKE
jgi:hypothetical protein